MKRSTGMVIDKTIFHVNNHFDTYTKTVIERHDWTDVGKKGTNTIETIHPDCMN